jgi:hypothetical protein
MVKRLKRYIHWVLNRFNPSSHYASTFFSIALIGHRFKGIVLIVRVKSNARLCHIRQGLGGPDRAYDCYYRVSEYADFQQ